MTIQLNHNIDLNDQRVFEWLQGGGFGEFREQLDDAALSAEGLELVDHSARNIGSVQQISYVSAVVQHYQLIKTDANTGKQRKLKDLSIQIPVTHSLNLGIESVLYISKEISNEGRKVIENAYSEFDGNSGSDPITYIAKQLNSKSAVDSAITVNDFYVALLYTLTQIGKPIRQLNQVKELKRHYNEGGAGSIEVYEVDGDEVRGDPNWFQKELIEIVFVRESEYQEFDNPEKHQVLQKDTNDTDHSNLLNEIVIKLEIKLNCDNNYIHQKRKVLTVFSWPEFKVDWVMREIVIGCARVKVKLPGLFIRTSKVVLYAIVALPKHNVGKVLLQIVIDCASKSALVGGVVGVVMWNFAAALAAFEALFENCISTQVFHNLTCMVPNLVLVTEKGHWGQL